MYSCASRENVRSDGSALLIDSIGARDYSTVQAAVMVVAMLVVLVNLLTDILYSFIDPRVRLG